MKEANRATLDLFLNLMHGFNFNAFALSREDFSLHPMDYGLRSTLFSISVDDLYASLVNTVPEHTVLHYIDEFQSHYIGLLLPEDYRDNADEPSYLIIGPYMTFQVTRKFLLEISEPYGVSPEILSFFDKYYRNVTYVKDDHFLLSALFIFADAVYGGSSCYSYQTISKNQTELTDFISIINFQADSESSLLDVSVIERNYEAEHQILEIIRQGQISRLNLLFQENSSIQTLFSNAEVRISDPIRNLKNYMIVANTLFRKAAENGGVTPVLIHQVSSDFAMRIESIHSVSEGNELISHMIRKYCQLVHNHSTKGYSQPIQKILTHINTDLKDDLTLQTFADELNMNASYLSALFKKEVGMSLTEYVNRKRMEHAVMLLNTTSLQIQTIAQQCGILDVNYFTKTFKKYIGTTPSKYRSSLH